VGDAATRSLSKRFIDEAAAGKRSVANADVNMTGPTTPRMPQLGGAKLANAIKGS
jgi:hypothetical protein